MFTEMRSIAPKVMHMTGCSGNCIEVFLGNTNVTIQIARTGQPKPDLENIANMSVSQLDENIEICGMALENLLPQLLKDECLLQKIWEEQVKVCAMINQKRLRLR